MCDQVQVTAVLTSERNSRTHEIGRYVDHTLGQDVVNKRKFFYSYGLKPRPTPSLVSTPSPSSTGINVKVKFTLEQATKAQSGNRGIALLFL